MKPHADFMEIWEEGYLSQRHDFAAMHTQAVMVLDGAALRLPDGTLDLDRLTSYIGALARRPTARLRLQRSLLGLTPPAWVPDEDFDLAGTSPSPRDPCRWHRSPSVPSRDGTRACCPSTIRCGVTT